jgi:cell division protein FtsB
MGEYARCESQPEISKEVLLDEVQQLKKCLERCHKEMEYHKKENQALAQVIAKLQMDLEWQIQNKGRV